MAGVAEWEDENLVEEKLQPEAADRMREQENRKGDNPHMLVVNHDHLLSLSALRGRLYIHLSPCAYATCGNPATDCRHSSLDLHTSRITTPSFCLVSQGQWLLHKMPPTGQMCLAAGSSGWIYHKKFHRMKKWQEINSKFSRHWGRRSSNDNLVSFPGHQVVKLYQTHWQLIDTCRIPFSICVLTQCFQFTPILNSVAAKLDAQSKCSSCLLLSM